MSTSRDGGNPFAPPKAAVLEPAVSESGLLGEGRKVAASRGAGWFADGWRLFKLAPGTWIVMFLVFSVMWIALAIVPGGSLLGSLLYPVFAGGIMLGCRKLEDGDGLQLSDLFSGFKKNTGNLLLVGLLYLASTFMIGILVGIGVAVMVPLMKGTTAVAPTMMTLAPIFALVFLVVMALMVPIFMAIWFAPAIVVFHDAQPMASLRASFSGCLRNLVPFLLYGIVGLALAIVAMLPVGLGFLVLGPVVWGAMYAGYRDIFLQRD
ncbi:MAG TPA: BPSS1780 family membrane protein [Usitatibacter sp.]|nr:BPSS1780 family membrane protein [Usitatibacter sp.]